MDSMPIHYRAHCDEEGSGVETWPHIHLNGPSGERAVVTVTLVTWRGQDRAPLFRDDKLELQDWSHEVRPPGWIARRLFGITMGDRIIDAALQLQQRWAERNGLYAAARDAVARITGEHD